MRWMNRAAAATILIAVVAGPPLLATAWLQDHPWRPPTTAQLQAWTRQPLTAGTIIAGCLAITAACWLALVWQMLRRGLGHAVRGWRRLRRLPLPTPAQMTAGSMAGVAALTFPHTDTTQPTVPPPSSPEQTDHPTDPAQASPPGIELPGGGWIPYPTALTVSAVVALIWRHRRQRYRPDPARIGTHHSDPDLQPLPATADAITAALNDDPPPDPPPTAPLIDQLPAGVLHLDGPGAAAAARGLLVTTALTAATTTPTSPIRVRASDLRHLLPGLDPQHPQLTGLIADGDTVSTPPRSDNNSTRDSQPPTTATTPRRLHRTGPDPGTTIVLTATTEAAAHWHVAADGTVTQPGTTRSRRFCVLDERAATDLLDLVQHTRTAGEPATPATPATEQPVHPPAVPSPDGERTARLTLLGTCQLTVAGNPVKLRRTAALQILAYLAIHVDGATRSELTRAIWPQLPPASISQRLHTTLTDLRKQLRPLLGGDPVIRRDNRYRLNVDIIDTDLRELQATAWAAVDRAPTTGAQLVGEPPQQLAAGWDWPWLAPAREALRRDILDAYVSLAEHPWHNPNP